MNVITKVASSFFLVLVLSVVWSLFVGLLIMWLWNACLVGAVSIVVPIGYWQGFGISFLCSLLFKNYLSVTKT